MKMCRVLQVAFFLLLTPICMAQNSTYFWAYQQVFVTIDNSTGYAYVSGCKSPLIPTGNITVKPNPGVDINTITSMIDGDISIEESDNYGGFIIRPQNGQNVFDVANTIYESGQVIWSYPEFKIEIVLTQNDPFYPRQYYLNNTGQPVLVNLSGQPIPTSGGNTDIDINAPEAWAITKGVSKVKVAVIDTGVNGHKEFEENTPLGIRSRILLGFDASNSANPGSSISNASHGELVTGIIAASHNLIGIAGVAPCSDIVPVNIFTSPVPGGIMILSDTDLAKSINWAWDQGQADILNNSWAMQTGSPHFPAIDDAIKAAMTQGRGNKGCPVVFGAGNDALGTVSYPANLPGVIAVGALNKYGNRASYSNYGPEIAVVAIGGESDIISTNFMDPSDPTGASANSYSQYFQGTSAACPQVAGALALMMSVNPNLYEYEYAQILKNTATHMPSALPGAPTTGRNNEFGYGRLNVEAALRSAAPILGPSTINYDFPNAGAPNDFTIPNQPSGTTFYWSATPANAFLPANRTSSNFSLTSSQAYYYQTSGEVSVTITGPCGTATLTKEITFPGFRSSTGKRGIGQNTSAVINIYPNPANSSLTVELTSDNTNNSTKIELFDIFGNLRFITETTEKSVNMPVQSLLNGLYSLRVTDTSGTTNRKVVIKH